MIANLSRFHELAAGISDVFLFPENSSSGSGAHWKKEVEFVQIGVFSERINSALVRHGRNGNS